MRFLLFDKIVGLKKGISCVGVKNVTIGEDFFKDHYARKPLMPEPLLIESIAQVGGWAVTLSSDYKHSVILAKIGNARFFKSVRPGDQLIIQTEILSSNDYGSVIKGSVTVGGEVAAEVDSISYVHHKILETGREELINSYIFNSGGFLDNDGKCKDDKQWNDV